MKANRGQIERALDTAGADHRLFLLYGPDESSSRALAARIAKGLGADAEDLVPFEKYAKAAEGLGKPSSAARALFGGAANIERVDCLVRRIAQQQGLQSETLDEIVRLVDARLEKNRAAR